MAQLISSFEDLIAWQKARQLTKNVYMATKRGDFARDFGLASQIQRASVSIMANIAEGYERRGAGEYLYFPGVAKASCAEVASHLYVGLDIGYLHGEDFDSLMGEAKEVGRILAGLKASLQRSPRRLAATGVRHTSGAPDATSDLGPRTSDL